MTYIVILMSFQTISSINYALSCQLSSVAEWSGQCTGLAQVSVRFLLEDLRTFSLCILLATGCCGFYNRRGGAGKWFEKIKEHQL